MAAPNPPAPPKETTVVSSTVKGELFENFTSDILKKVELLQPGAIVTGIRSPDLLSNDQEEKVIEVLHKYCKNICGSDSADNVMAMTVAMCQSMVTHTTSKAASRDENCVVDFMAGGKSYTFNKKDFWSMVHSEIGGKVENPERRFARGIQAQIVKMVEDGILQPPLKQAAKHGALQGYEGMVLDIMTTSLMNKSDSDRTAHVLAKRNALGNSRGNRGAIYNISQMIDGPRQ